MKILNTISTLASIGLIATTSYLLVSKNKKNMLDVLIEEIETIK